jgi:hypothetical protein
MGASQNLGPVALFAQFAAVAKSLAVEVLAERTGLSVANASQHLQQTRRAGIRHPPRRQVHLLHAQCTTPMPFSNMSEDTGFQFTDTAVPRAYEEVVFDSPLQFSSTVRAVCPTTAPLC